MNKEIDNVVVIDRFDYDELVEMASAAEHEIERRANELYMKSNTIPVKIEFYQYLNDKNFTAPVTFSRRPHKEEVHEALDRIEPKIKDWMDENLKMYAKNLRDKYTDREDCIALKKRVANLDTRAEWQKTQKLDLQKLWEQSIQLDGLYNFYEAQEKCPKGYRVPTFTEWAWLIDNTEYSFDRETKEGVFTFSDGVELRLPAAGYRSVDGSSRDQGTYGHYWSSSVSGTYGRLVYFGSGVVETYTDHQVFGFSLRCLPIEIK